MGHFHAEPFFFFFTKKEDVVFFKSLFLLNCELLRTQLMNGDRINSDFLDLNKITVFHLLSVPLFDLNFCQMINVPFGWVLIFTQKASTCVNLQKV